MASVNKVILIGRLGKDVEMRSTPDGSSVGSFSLATNRKVKEKDHTDWHNIVVWKKVADNCAKYIKKGSQVYLEGEISTRSWEKKDGTKGYTTEITAHTVQFLDSKPQGGQQSQHSDDPGPGYAEEAL